MWFTSATILILIDILWKIGNRRSCCKLPKAHKVVRVTRVIFFLNLYKRNNWRCLLRNENVNLAFSDQYT